MVQVTRGQEPLDVSVRSLSWVVVAETRSDFWTWSGPNPGGDPQNNPS